MNGDRYLLDTNAVIALLKGDKEILYLINEASWIGISIITELEFLSFPELEDNDRKLFDTFLSRIHVVALSHFDYLLIEKTVSLRKERGIKLPDAFIAATAIASTATLVTKDETLLQLAAVSTKRF